MDCSSISACFLFLFFVFEIRVRGRQASALAAEGRDFLVEIAVAFPYVSINIPHRFNPLENTQVSPG